jgi:hypothetical protein
MDDFDLLYDEFFGDDEEEKMKFFHSDPLQEFIEEITAYTDVKVVIE